MANDQRIFLQQTFLVAGTQLRTAKTKMQCVFKPQVMLVYTTLPGFPNFPSMFRKINECNDMFILPRPWGPINIRVSLEKTFSPAK